jgi:hypothetical protein
MKHIFIAHSAKDTRYLATVRDVLLQANFKPWIDPQPRPGMDWRLEVDEAIRAADLVLVIMTPQAAESVYVTYEWALALGLKIPVMLLTFKPAQFHPRLQGLIQFDLNAWKDERQFWDYFVRELRRLFASRELMPVETQPRPPGDVAGAVGTNSVIPAVKPPTAQRVVMPQERGHWIVIRRGPHLNTMFRLEKEVVTVGRDAANDITINDAELSRFHLKLHRQAQGYAVEDLGSTNGTHLDQQRVQGMIPLTAGKTLQLGNSILISYEVVP